MSEKEATWMLGDPPQAFGSVLIVENNAAQFSGRTTLQGIVRRLTVTKFPRKAVFRIWMELHLPLGEHKWSLSLLSGDGFEELLVTQKYENKIPGKVHQIIAEVPMMFPRAAYYALGLKINGEKVDVHPLLIQTKERG